MAGFLLTVKMFRRTPPNRDVLGVEGEGGEHNNIEQTAGKRRAARNVDVIGGRKNY